MIATMNPALMTSDQRLDEAASILATAVLRLLKKQKTEQISLAIPPIKRPYVSKNNQNGERA